MNEAIATMPETVSAVICTKDRPDDVVRAVASLLEDDSHQGDVIVVDQSDGAETASALNRIEDERLRYVRSRTTGKGAALNEGLALAESRYVACTDDDCEASPQWARLLIRPMVDDPRVALVFSRVDAPQYDRTTGYIPEFLATSDRVVEHPLALGDRFGLGASMCVRRDVLLDVGGFDEAMGPGGFFRSGDDFDVSLRLLLLGWRVYETTEASVVHYGFRSNAEGRAHTVRDWFALGASCAKAVRAGHLQVLLLSTSLVGRRALWPSFKALAALRRPPLRRVWAFTSGFFAGLRHPVDRETLLYILPNEQSSVLR